MPPADRLRLRRRDARADVELSGLDTLDLPLAPRRGALVRVVEGLWPKLAAIAIALAAWQLVVLSGWRPEYVLPGPVTVLQRLVRDLADNELLVSVAITLRRGAVGFFIAIVVGTGIALAVVRFRSLRVAVASLVSGLTTMPSIAWFPLAILLFRLSEAAILFVVVLGAAPAIANGLIAGIDHIPRITLRAGRAMGARGLDFYRHVLLPAALPSFVSGLKQGWAFAWRSLLAGELLVIIAAQPSIGVRLAFSREISDAPGLLATMVVILVIGLLMDALFFSSLDRAIRRRWGLVEDAT